MEVVTKQEATSVQESISLNVKPKKSESLDWTDFEDEEEKDEEAEVEMKDSEDIDDEALVKLIARLKEK